MPNISVEELISKGALDVNALYALARMPGLSPEEAVVVMLHRARSALDRDDRLRLDVRRIYLTMDLMGLLESAGIETRAEPELEYALRQRRRHALGEKGRGRR